MQMKKTEEHTEEDDKSNMMKQTVQFLDTCNCYDDDAERGSNDDSNNYDNAYG